jgi:hypothetical protein
MHDSESADLFTTKRRILRSWGWGLTIHAGECFWVCVWTCAWRWLMTGIFGILEPSATHRYQDVAQTQKSLFFIVTSIVYALDSYRSSILNFLTGSHNKHLEGNGFLKKGVNVFHITETMESLTVITFSHLWEFDGKQQECDGERSGFAPPWRCSFPNLTNQKHGQLILFRSCEKYAKHVRERHSPFAIPICFNTTKSSLSSKASEKDNRYSDLEQQSHSLVSFLLARKWIKKIAPTQISTLDGP